MTAISDMKVKSYQSEDHVVNIESRLPVVPTAVDQVINENIAS